MENYTKTTKKGGKSGLYALLAAALLAGPPAVAAGLDKAMTFLNPASLTAATDATESGDYTFRYDADADNIVKVDATDLSIADDLTVGDDLTVTDSLTAEDVTVNRAPSADSATTNIGADLNLSTPVDTTGTNTHNALGIDFTIGNATGGTNSARGVRINAVTGDAQVNVQGVSVGTGTILGTSIGLFVDSGWDAAAELNLAAAADSGATNLGLDIDLASPVDTTGTNIHNGINIDPTIGNATGGTNTVNGLFFANVTGDAQVNVNAVKIGTGTLLGTSYGIDIGSGWDAGLNTASPVLNALTPGADSAATNTASTITFTTPVDTTGTNAHNGLLINATIGNASGGTNTFDALEFGAITGDAQVTETAIKIGSGYDAGIVTDGSVKINSTNGTAISAIRIATDTDLDNGQTSEAVTVTGATSASLCFATITNDSTNEVSVTNVVAGTDGATVQVSADPGASGADLAVICYN